MQASRTISRQAPALQEQNRETGLDGQPIVHWTQKGCCKGQIKVPGEKDGNVCAEQSGQEKMKAYLKPPGRKKKWFQEEADRRSTDRVTQIVELRAVNLIN